MEIPQKPAARWPESTGSPGFVVAVDPCRAMRTLLGGDRWQGRASSKRLLLPLRQPNFDLALSAPILQFAGESGVPGGMLRKFVVEIGVGRPAIHRGHAIADCNSHAVRVAVRFDLRRPPAGRQDSPWL